MIMYNFTDRVRGEGEIPECSVRSRPEQPPESDAGSSRPAEPAPSTGRAVEHSVFGSWTSDDI